MSKPGWFDDFLGESAADPRRLIQVIAAGKAHELRAAAKALELLENPLARTLGYAAIAQRSYAHRAEFLARTAASADTLIDPTPRAGVLLSVFDALPRRESAELLDKVNSILNEVSPDLRDAYRRRLVRRAARAEIVSLPNSGFDVPGRIDVDIDDAIKSLGTMVARVGRPLLAKPFTIRPIGTRPNEAPAVRFGEIARALDISPRGSAGAFESGRGVGEAPIGHAELSPYAIVQSENVETRERVVSTGFASTDGEPRAVPNALELNYFFVEVGPPVPGAIESGEVLPEDLAAGSLIDVVMYTNDDGLVIDGPRKGRFRIEDNGEVTVDQPAAAIATSASWAKRRMFFAFRLPAESRPCSMRCSFFCRGGLIQSRNITVLVGSNATPTIQADYVQSRALSPRALAMQPRTALSILLNDNADGTHSFRFYGDDGNFVQDCALNALALSDLIETARKGMRRVAWGTDVEWTPNEVYRFSKPQTIQSVRNALYHLAHVGRTLWDGIVDILAGGRDASDKLREMMRRPGLVQLALKEAASHVLPLALFYDHEFDAAHIDEENPPLCDAFIRSLGDDLMTGPCFNGDCPNRDHDTVICPSGFWGFRHAIGFPTSIGSQSSDPPEIDPYISQATPSFVVGVSTDPAMKRTTSHLASLALKSRSPQQVSTTRDDALAAMKATVSPIVYFYCHGGIHDVEGPFIEVGPRGGPRIARQNLRPIRWSNPRPLVFVNGCHTTNVSPEKALNLVSAFVRGGGASGVIGTEITVFESLATQFADEFFEQFVANGEAAGEAMRRARLRLLQRQLNPLGLAYIAFVNAGLRLSPRAA